jgi:Glutaminase
MAKAEAIVSRTIRLEPGSVGPAAGKDPGEGGSSIVLDGDRRVRLDPADPRSRGLAQVLDGLSREHLPVYLEIDPVTELVSRLLIPRITRVEAVRDHDDGLEVILSGSHARHRLKRDQPDYETLAAELRASLESHRPLLITEEDAQGIIDIREYSPDPQGPAPPFPEPGPSPLPLPRTGIWRLLYPIWYWPWWPWWWWRWFLCLSTTRAHDIFASMAATSCLPLTVPVPCIPFLYPDDGCWARAHEMSRLMLAMGAGPGKVWIYGNLNVNTRNNPSCSVGWWYHVAPTICVRSWFPLTRRMVVDPSLFADLVSEATWKGVQGDASANLVDTSWTQYGPGGGTDPTFSDTATQLAYYRLQLQSRSIQVGPPPYANCP